MIGRRSNFSTFQMPSPFEDIITPNGDSPTINDAATTPLQQRYFNYGATSCIADTTDKDITLTCTTMFTMPTSPTGISFNYAIHGTSTATSGNPNGQLQTVAGTTTNGVSFFLQNDARCSRII